MTADASPLATLAAGLEAEFVGTRAELTEFPAGGAMLDVRRGDGRLFVLAYTPAQGYGVDEVQPPVAFETGYRYAYTELPPAAEKLRELLADSALGGRGASPIALNLVVVQARDLEAAKRFYEAIGLTFVTEQHGRGPKHYAASVGQTVFEVYPCQGDAMCRPARIGFEVQSLDEVLTALRQQSTAALKEPADSPWGRRIVVQDPDGNRVELTEARSNTACRERAYVARE
jgi:predicted enzyme related to lactoylglutathione lyase